MFLTAVSPSLHLRTPKTSQEVRQALQSLPVSHTMSARKLCSALIGALRPHPPDETFPSQQSRVALKTLPLPSRGSPVSCPTPKSSPKHFPWDDCPSSAFRHCRLSWGCPLHTALSYLPERKPRISEYLAGPPHCKHKQENSKQNQ